MGLEGSLIDLAATTTAKRVLVGYLSQEERGPKEEEEGNLTCVALAGQADCNLAADASGAADDERDRFLGSHDGGDACCVRLIRC